MSKKLQRNTDTMRIVWLSDCTVGECQEAFHLAFLAGQENETPKARALRWAIDKVMAREEGGR